MTITLGNETINISEILETRLRKITENELIELEKRKHGARPKPNVVLTLDLNEVLQKYAGRIGRRLAEPRLISSDLPRSNSILECWCFRRDGSHSFTLINSPDILSKKDFYGDIEYRNYLYEKKQELPTFSLDEAYVLWEFEIKYNSENGVVEKTTRVIRVEDIVEAVEQLWTLDEGSKFERAVSRFLNGYDNKSTRKDIAPFYEGYLEWQRKFSEYSKTQREFYDTYENSSVLEIILSNSSKTYVDKYCGFDVETKKEEIDSCIAEYHRQQDKLRNSTNDGEKDVEYALKWFMASSEHYVVKIKNDCESRYRYNCIVLRKTDFIDEAQEYDHILVCSAGVILIETKHWKGRVEIRTDGKWTRKTEEDNGVFGVESPSFQMRRHEVLMKNILPDVPVYSVLCFSNSSIIIDGRENFTDYPILTIDQLEKYITLLCDGGSYSKDDIDRMVALIESYKVQQ